MQLMIDYPGLRRRQARLAPDAFKKFAMDNCIDRYLEIYSGAAA